MANLEVIYDPAKELAAIINTDDRQGWGPAMIGPQAGMILQTFLDTVPFDLSIMSSYDATQAFSDFLRTAGLAADETAATPVTPSESPTDPGVDTTAATAAEHEARDNTTVPPEQPHDTDTPVVPDTTDTVIPCVNCGGGGTVQVEPDTDPVKCGMCGGTGKLTIQAPVEA